MMKIIFSVFKILLILKISAWDILYSLIVYNFNYLDTAVSAPTVTAMTAMKSAY